MVRIHHRDGGVFGDYKVWLRSDESAVAESVGLLPATKGRDRALILGIDTEALFVVSRETSKGEDLAE
jgi:hypothetical protein